jgi:hypothetical protein
VINEENEVILEEIKGKKCREYKGFTIEITIEIKVRLGDKWKVMEKLMVQF